MRAPRPSSPLAAVGVAVLVALSAGACSDQSDKKADTTSGVVPTSATAASPTPAAAATSTAAPATTVARTTTSAAPDRVVTLARFQTPTGNIACDAADGEVRCDIRDKSWTPPPKPADCDLDWGTGFAILRDGTPTGVCAGDTVLDPGLPRLGYGEATRVGPVVCSSRLDGLTCTSDRTRRGFFLSKDSYRLF